MRDRTYYKMPDGSIYSVSPRVIANGVKPLEGAVELTTEEQEAFILGVEEQRELASRLTEEERQNALKMIQPFSTATEEEKNNFAQLLAAKFFPIPVIKSITGVTVPDPAKEARKLARAEKQAAIEADKQAAIEAEKQAVIEAEKQAKVEKRQEVLRAKIEQKKAAEEAARIEILVAERVAKIQAEKEAEKQAAIEAEKQAAIEASKPRNFSTA